MNACIILYYEYNFSVLLTWFSIRLFWWDLQFLWTVTSGNVDIRALLFWGEGIHCGKVHFCDVKIHLSSQKYNIFCLMFFCKYYKTWMYNFFWLFWENRFVKYCSFDVKNSPLILKFSIFMLPELLLLLVEAFCFWVTWRSTCRPRS